MRHLCSLPLQQVTPAEPKPIAGANDVQNLPAIDSRQRVERTTLLLSIRNSRQDPRRNLPIAADPAVLPLAVAGVVIRKLLEEFHVGRQSHANMGSFDEIVTEQPLLRETPGQYFGEGLDVVDGFPVIDCGAEYVLIDVGNGL